MLFCPPKEYFLNFKNLNRFGRHKMKKILLILPLLSMSVYAQLGTAPHSKSVSSGTVPKSNEMHEFKPLDIQVINDIINKENLLGKKLTSSCNIVDVNKTCKKQLYKVFKLGDGNKIRVIRYGDSVTMDYFPNRLNVDLDKQDKITRITIG